MRKLICIALLFLSTMAFAGSTINPSVPAANSSLSSAPLRINFAAAYADINNILSQFSATTAPASPSRYQYWLDTSSSPSMVLKIYDGISWVSVGRLNTSAHTWSFIGSYSGSPISTTYGGTGSDLHAATGAVSMSSGVTSVGTLPASYLAAPLTALATYNTNGLLTQTAANTFTGRALTGTAAEITVTNGSGVSGNPTLSLPSALTFTGKTVTGGTFASPAITTPTGIVKGDVGLGNVDNTSDATKNAATATLTNKTITAPVISTIVNNGTLTLPTSTDTLIGKATTDTLTNKTYDTAGSGNSFSINGLAATANTGTGAVVRGTTPTIATPVINGLPTGTGIATANTVSTLVARDGSGNFAAGTITAALSGNATTATSATTATTATNQSGGTVSATTLTASGNIFGTTLVATPDTGRSAANSLRLRNATSTSATSFALMPNSATQSGIRLYNADDSTGTNTGAVDFNILGTTVSFTPNSWGTGTAPTLLTLGMTTQLPNATYLTTLNSGGSSRKLIGMDGSNVIQIGTDGQTVNIGSGGMTNSTSYAFTNLLASATAPTISSGFGSSPSIASSNGTATFRVNVGTGGSASSGVIGLPTATTGWNCLASNVTTTSGTVFMTKQTASTTTTVTIGNFNTSAASAAWASGDVIQLHCLAY